MKKKEILAKVEDAEKKVKELKVSVADYVVIDDNDDSVDYGYLFDDMSYRLQYLNQSISDLYSLLFQHMNDGHLPPIEGADRMQKALDALGLSGDYQVQKRTIYASNGKPEKWIFELSPKKNV